MNHHDLTFIAFCSVRSCCATTDNTSISMRLNSSKQAQAPLCASPAKKRPMKRKSRASPELKTTQFIPRARLRSLIVSVFPVPAGPVRPHCQICRHLLLSANVCSGFLNNTAPRSSTSSTWDAHGSITEEVSKYGRNKYGHMAVTKWNYRTCMSVALKIMCWP